MLNEIKWPEKYLPGTTDNFVSNEIIVKNASAEDVFKCFIDTSLWPDYYGNVTDIHFYNSNNRILNADTKFRFKTFGFLVEAEIVEYVPPKTDEPARIAWRGYVEGDEEHRLDVTHAWLFEDLSNNRVRILTQESQIGKPAKDLFNTTPDIMNQEHQNWIKGLAKTVLAGD